MLPWVLLHQHVGQDLTLSCQSCCVFVKGKECIRNSAFSVDTDRSWRSEAMICFTQSEEDGEPEMRWDLVLYQEVPGLKHVSPLCMVAVYLSSIKLKWYLPGLFIYLGYLRADVIRAWCSGGATSLLAYYAPSLRSSVWKIHPKIHPLGSDQRHTPFHPLTVAVIQLACSPSSYILILFTMSCPALNT